MSTWIIQLYNSFGTLNTILNILLLTEFVSFNTLYRKTFVLTGLIYANVQISFPFQQKNLKHCDQHGN